MVYFVFIFFFAQSILLFAPPTAPVEQSATLEIQADFVIESTRLNCRMTHGFHAPQSTLFRRGWRMPMLFRRVVRVALAQLIRVP